jgi:hypothetical protein
MKTNPVQTRTAAKHPFQKLTLLVLSCLLLSAASVVAEPPARPVVAPGGNNWIPPTGPVTRALGTQDLNAGLTPTDLVTALLGPGVVVSNVTFTGANVAAGKFTGGTGIIGFDSGIILSSGDIAFVPGPNTQDSITANNGLPGDPALDALIPGYTTFDACILEFDFECTGTQAIQFQYVFSSDEYNEWVNSPYNDVFAFFLNGVNIAAIPGGGGLAVSIDNLNCNNPYNPPTGSFCNLFVNNRCADIPPGTFPCAGVVNTEMDGLTVVLTATGTINPGLNHIKLAIADAGDPVLDSNVFIQGQSFVCGQPTGACCDTSTLTCQDNVLQANCQGPYDVWNVGLACSQLQPPCASVTNPPGTNCDNPIPITALPYTDVNTTYGKDNDYTNTCLGNFDNGDDILYVLTISATQCVNITVTGATPADDWIGVAVDTVCPPGATCLAQATTPDSVAIISNLTLTPGTYYLMIDRWPAGDDSLNYTLSITDCQALTGACCFTGSLCQVLTALDCDAAGGNFVGAGLTCDPNPCICPGDVNCDGLINFGDINPFVLILSNFQAWQTAYPGCPWENGDINGDSTVSFGDINPFVAVMSSGQGPCHY